MPRIRYRRSYDFTLFEQSDERDYGEEQEEISGQSWLSNAAIASQLPESRIKDAIKSLKNQIAVLEAELLSRRFNHSSRPHENWNEIGNVRRKKVTKEPTINARDRRRDLKSIRHIKVTLAKLGVTDVDALIVEWEKIQQKLNAQKENDEKS